MAADPQVAAVLKSLGESQIKVLTGTVTDTPTNAQVTPVRLDNQPVGTGLPEPLLIPSICGIIPAGTRVTIFTVPPAGMVIVGIIGAPYDLIELWNYFLTNIVPVYTNQIWMDRRIYTANDTWNKPTSPLFLGVQVMIQSGGGGSGGTAATVSRTSGSGGGQGGGYIEILVLAASLTGTVAVTVGAGGAAAAAGANPGGTGGASSFGTYGSIAGGEGGAGGSTTASNSNTTQAGGTGTQSAVLGGGAVLLDYQQGDDGGTGFRFGNPPGDTCIMPGFGGGSRMSGITKVGTRSSGEIPPVAGWPFGGGASGRGVAVDIAAAGGAPGGQGLVIVKEIYRT